jgi:ParB family chromosome partitioning protein
MSKLDRFKGLTSRAFETRAGGAGAGQTRNEQERAEPRGGTERMPGARLIPLDRLAPDPEQPRKRFTAASLEELAASVRIHGVLQPLLVSPEGDSGDYRIVAGERRYRAARLAGLDRVPCIVTTDLDAGVRLEQQLVENLQREGIAPLEECAALEALRDRCGLTHQQIAQRLGKSRTYVTKTLALRKLPVALRAELTEAGVTAREQLVLIAQQPDEDAMWHLWRTMAEGQRDVRSLRRAAKPAAAPGERTQAGASVKLRAESSNAIVTIRFRRARVSSQDIIRALEEVVADIRKRDRG